MTVRTWILGLIVSILPSISQAALFAEHFNRMTDRKLESFAQFATQSFEALSQAAPEGERWDTLRFKMERKDVPGERWNSIIKEAIYRDRNFKDDESSPDWVELEEVVKTKTALRTAFLSTVYRNVDWFKYKRIADAVVDEFIGAVKGRLGFRVFKGSDGNSFGDCAWISVTDFGNKEVLFLQSCTEE